jgi:hypothetical protein
MILKGAKLKRWEIKEREDRKDRKDRKDKKERKGKDLTRDQFR